MLTLQSEGSEGRSYRSLLGRERREVWGGALLLTCRVQNEVRGEGEEGNERRLGVFVIDMQGAESGQGSGGRRYRNLPGRKWRGTHYLPRLTCPLPELSDGSLGLEH